MSEGCCQFGGAFLNAQPTVVDGRVWMVCVDGF